MMQRYRGPWVVAIVLVLASCGGGGGQQMSQSTTTTGPTSTTVPAAAPAQRLDVTTAPWQLPAPTSRAVLLTDGPSLVLLGGQNAQHASIAAGYVLDPATGASVAIGPLNPAVHDAAGVRLGSQNLVIAGGTPPARAGVQAVTTGQPTQIIGQLAAARTDHVAALVAGSIYVLGGADASEAPIASVVTSTNGVTWSDAGALAAAVRYPAVAAVDNSVYLFGGVGSSHVDTTAIQRYDPATHVTTVVAQLPAPLSHATAVVVGGVVWLLGGFVSDKPSTQVLRFDPRTNTVTAAGVLPAPVTDAAGAVTAAGTGYLVGGEGPARTTTAVVLVLTAH